jgi:epoxide hydrolase-like predicted phosphatase
VGGIVPVAQQLVIELPSGELMNSDTIKAIVFDMGGVFVQTTDKNPRSNLAKKYGLDDEALSLLVFQSETAQKATIGEIDENDHWKFIGDHFGLNSSELANFQEDFWGGDILDQELVRFTKTLKEKYPIGLLSNAWSGARALLTRKFGFLDLFDVSVFSAEVKMAKPDPKFYFWMLDKLNVNAEEALFVDDFIENITAAKELGFKTVHFKNTIGTINKISELIAIH